MKKIISLIIAFMMFTTTVMANAVDGFSEAWEKYSQLKSYSGSTVMSVEVNEPLLFLEDIPLDDSGVDYPLMINDLLTSTATAEYSVNVSDDYKKMQMAMSIAYDVPITMNEDFKIDAWARIGMWLDYDMTNPEAPVYKMIIKTPLDSKYQVMDMSAEAESMAGIITPEMIDDLSDGMRMVIESNGEVTKIKNGYRIKFDNDSLFSVITNILKVAKPFVTDEVDQEMLGEMISSMEWARDNLVILGEDGLTLEFTQNARGDITATLEAVHFDFNIYDIATLAEADTEGLQRERANVNVTLKSVSEITGHNATEVIIPELTEENSVDVYGENDYESGYYTEVGSPLFCNNATYYSLNEITAVTGIDFAPVYENGVLTLTNENGDVVTVSGNVIAMGDDQWDMGKPQMTESDGGIYVTEDVLGLLYIDPFASYDTFTKGFTYSLWHESYISYPYVPSSEDDVDEYIPEYYRVYVYSDQVPYIEDGEVFIPVYDTLRSIKAGEFDITMEGLDYTSNGENRYGIENVSVKVGENTVTVDGETITLEKPIVNVANIFRAPLEFVEKLGFTVEDIWLRNDGTSYTLSMPNPAFFN